MLTDWYPTVTGLALMKRAAGGAVPMAKVTPAVVLPAPLDAVTT